MFKNVNLVVIVLVNFFVIYSSCNDGGDTLLERKTKRADIDLSTCIDNFDIHKDKIIRTQDSQKMGAKYLNAIDLGSREECLRLCCETENCDVFVYEDKNSGSCYLFHCGPPEDFKCKFTHHVNYSSAVLAVNRHLPDLESQIKLTKHEQDLSELRKPLAPDSAHSLVSTSTTVKTNEISAEQIKKFEAKKCSRYQFECRSTGDCIAIYNACDGVAQCADASDEAPELGCPDASTQSSTNNNIRGTGESKKTTSISDDKKTNSRKNEDQQSPFVALRPETGVVAPPPPPPPDNNGQSIMVPPPPNRDFLRPMLPNQEQRMVAPQFQEPSLSIYNKNPQTSSWGMLQPKDQKIPYQYNNNNRNNNNGNVAPAFPGEANTLIRTYPEYNPKITNYYGENYRQPMESPNWVNAHQEDLRYPTRYNQEPSYINNNNINNDINRALGNNNNNNNKYIPQEKSLGWTTENKENPEHIQIKMAHELEQSKGVLPSKNERKTIKIIEKSSETTKADDFPDVVAYKMDGNDGVAQTPGGAVLSLTLGLIITCIMALMIGCRLRIVKRRIRKGGKGYAHDADYLVNGMYL